MSLSEQQEAKLVKKILHAKQMAIKNKNISEGLTSDEEEQIKKFLKGDPRARTEKGQKIQDEALEYIQRKGAQAGLLSLQNSREDIAQEEIAKILLELKNVKEGGKRRSTKRKKTNKRRRRFSIRKWFSM